MIAIYLHGAAGQQFGGPFHLDVASPAEAFHALCRMKRGFKQFLAAGDWRIIRGKTKSAVKQGRDCYRDELEFGFGRVEEMHVIPVMSGAGKGKGIGKIVAGVAIIALSIFTAGGALAGLAGALAAVGVSSGGLAMLGVSLVLGGVSQILTKTPKASKANDIEDSTQRTNALFAGPVNVGELGQTIPVVYSDEEGVLVGTVVGSAGLATEQIPVA